MACLAKIPVQAFQRTLLPTRTACSSFLRQSFRGVVTSFPTIGSSSGSNARSTYGAQRSCGMQVPLSPDTDVDVGIGAGVDKDVDVDVDLIADAALSQVCNNRSMYSSYGSVPLKVMIFMDGTWVYYSLLKGRSFCPVKIKYGDKWKISHRVDWRKLTKNIADNIQRQLFPDPSVGNRGVEIVRTNAFTSSRKDTNPEGVRMRMVKDFQKNNFDTHLYETMGLQEKCVDISLAVEMLYLATVPGIY